MLQKSPKILFRTKKKRPKMKKDANEAVDFEEEKRKDPKYKTEICKSWAQTHCCIYGNKCRFAHGVNDLVVRDKIEHYKQKECQSFYNNGFCLYGSRCNFLHFNKHLNDINLPFYESKLIFGKQLQLSKGKRLKVFESLAQETTKIYNKDNYGNNTFNFSLNNNNSVFFLLNKIATDTSNDNNNNTTNDPNADNTPLNYYTAIDKFNTATFPIIHSKCSTEPFSNLKNTPKFCKQSTESTASKDSSSAQKPSKFTTFFPKNFTQNSSERMAKSAETFYGLNCLQLETDLSENEEKGEVVGCNLFEIRDGNLRYGVCYEVNANL